MIITCIFVFLCLVCFLLFAFVPIKNAVNDGGSVVYRPVSGLYEVWELHRIADENGGYIVGTAVELFGIEVYNNSTVIHE